MELIVSSRQHYKNYLNWKIFWFVNDFTFLHLWPDRRSGANPVKLLKASTFDNGDSKLKPKNPLLYKDLTDSIQVIS